MRIQELDAETARGPTPWLRVPVRASTAGDDEDNALTVWGGGAHSARRGKQRAAECMHICLHSRDSLNSFNAILDEGAILPNEMATHDTGAMPHVLLFALGFPHGGHTPISYFQQIRSLQYHLWLLLTVMLGGGQITRLV